MHPEVRPSLASQMPPLPESHIMPYPSPYSQMTKPAYPPQPEGPKTEETPVFSSSYSEAPVFIKIDKYEDTLAELSSIRTTAQNIRNIIEILNTMRDIQADALGILDGLTKELERSQARLDKVLGRMEAVEHRLKSSAYQSVVPENPPEVGNIEDRIKKLRDEIKKLERY